MNEIRSRCGRLSSTSVSLWTLDNQCLFLTARYVSRGGVKRRSSYVLLENFDSNALCYEWHGVAGPNRGLETMKLWKNVMRIFSIDLIIQIVFLSSAYSAVCCGDASSVEATDK